MYLPPTPWFLVFPLPLNGKKDGIKVPFTLVWILSSCIESISLHSLSSLLQAYVWYSKLQANTTYSAFCLGTWASDQVHRPIFPSLPFIFFYPFGFSQFYFIFFIFFYFHRYFQNACKVLLSVKLAQWGPYWTRHLVKEGSLLKHWAGIKQSRVISEMILEG